MKNLIFILLFAISLGLGSCNQNDDMTANEKAILSDPIVKEVISDEVFVNLANDYATFFQKFDSIFANTSIEDINIIIDLNALLKTDPDKYDVLLEAKLKELLGTDYEELSQLLIRIKTQNEVYNQKFNLSALSPEKNSYITNKLLPISIPEKYIFAPKMIAKTGESGYDSCVARCASARDADISYANDLFWCATAGGAVAWCAGIIGGASWIIETMGAAYARDAAVRNAWTHYDICVQGC